MNFAPQIIIYDCERGTQKRAVNSKKYGVDLIHFTQHKNNVVHASTKENDIIRYLNVEGNKYISYFRYWVLSVISSVSLSGTRNNLPPSFPLTFGCYHHAMIIFQIAQLRTDSTRVRSSNSSRIMFMLEFKFHVSLSNDEIMLTEFFCHPCSRKRKPKQWRNLIQSKIESLEKK